jgi:epsilon-lactone hydrolase
MVNFNFAPAPVGGKGKVVMPSFPARITKKLLHMKPYGWAKGSIHEQRLRQEKSTRFFKKNKDIIYRPVTIQDIPAEWIECIKPGHGVILYFHGGAYALGSINSHRDLLSRLASATNLKIVAINYRLAPEHPFPAALEDARTAYRWLLAQGYDSSRIAFAGDSAGGGLAISTLIQLQTAGEALPACAVCISPWTDLTLSGQSVKTKASADPMLNASLLEIYAKYYACGAEKHDPLVSPLFGELKDFPPLLIHVGTDEILLDDAQRLFENARNAGVDVTLKTWDQMFHVFQIIPYLPESKQSIEEIGRFLSEHLSVDRIQ